MSNLEEDKRELIHEIKHKLLCYEYEEADRLCDYYRLLYGNLPGDPTNTN